MLRKLSPPSGRRVCVGVRFDKKIGQFTDGATGNGVAAQEAEALSGEERDALQAYADGVNAYITANRGELGLEFVVLGLTGVNFEPDPWTPADTLSWAKVMAWDLGGNMDHELLRAHLAAALGDSAVRGGGASAEPPPPAAPATGGRHTHPPGTRSRWDGQWRRGTRGGSRTGSRWRGR